MAERNPDCIFCRIIGGAMPAAVIHEEEQLICFADAFPASRGHALVVPKAHHQDLLDLPVALVRRAAALAQRIARAQVQALAADGVTLTQFTGAAAGQTVFHYHVHVIPRWQGQELHAHGRRAAEPAALEAVAARIAAALPEGQAGCSPQQP